MATKIVKRSTPQQPRPFRSMPDTTRTEIRLRYRREKPQKAWRPYERDLLNLTRKLPHGERIAVVIFAEQLAMNRITARLQKRRVHG